MSDVTQILSAIEQGDAKAAEELLPLVYAELRQLAAKRLSEEPSGQTLQPTALVHEAYIRLVDSETASNWQSRGHFFSAAATAMRRILVENARRKQALKRGGDLRRQDVDAADIAAAGRDYDHLALDEALQQLAEQHPRKAKLVDLRYFAGLTTEQAARAVGVSLATAERDWRFARAWLHQELTRDRTGRG